MTASTETAPSKTKLGAFWRSLAVIGVALLAMLAAESAVSYVVVIAMFGGLPFLVGIPIVATVLVLVISSFSRAVTGRWHILGAITVTLALAVAGGYGLLNGILVPMFTEGDWWPHALVCVLAAGVLGLLLGPLALRIVGVACAVGLIATLALLPTSAEQAQEEYAQNQQEQQDEQLDYFLASGIHPIVTDLDGWSNVLGRATGGDAMTWVVSDDGAGADILVQKVDETAMDPTFPCTRIQREGDHGMPVNGALPEWFVETDTGWARADGAGVSFIQDGLLVGITSGNEYHRRDTGASRPAKPEEIAALAAAVRPMNDAEIEKWILPTYAGLDSPEVETPGL